MSRYDDPDEAGWQEQLVTHLSLLDWPRVEISDELDLLGPYARRLLGAHGNQFPFNAHFSAPLVEQARGGTLITGVGGDENERVIDDQGARGCVRHPGRGRC